MSVLLKDNTLSDKIPRDSVFQRLPVESMKTYGTAINDSLEEGLIADNDHFTFESADDFALKRVATPS